MKNPRNKQFISFKLCVLFWVAWWNLTPRISPLSSESTLYVSILPVTGVIKCGYQINCLGITVLVFKLPLFYLIMVPKHRSSDAGNSDSLLPCLIYKLNFIVCMYRKKHSIYRFGTILGCRLPRWGWAGGGVVLERIPAYKFSILLYKNRHLHKKWSTVPSGGQS